MIAKIRQFITEYKLLAPGDNVIIGLSGGADSVCLFRILTKLREEMNLNLIAVHIHHGIRGEEADSDEKFVYNLCKNHNVDFISEKYDIPAISKTTGESEEECGRRIRYEVFAKIAGQYANSKIAVAHHMNDQAETVIFRMVRGTGIKGIGGMKPRNGNIIRPLLCVTKKEIVSYLQDINEQYCIDSTNEDVRYSRNYIRKELLTRLEEVNPSITEHIFWLSDEANQVYEYMIFHAEAILNKATVYRKDCAGAHRVKEDGIVAKYMQDISVIAVYNVKQMILEKKIILEYALRHMIEKEGISLKDVTREHIDSIYGILDKEESSIVMLPRGIRILKENDFLILKDESRGCKASEYNMQIADDKEYELPDGSKVKTKILSEFDRSLIPQTTYTKWFDYDKLIDGLCVRTRQSGDYLVVNEAGSTKKLKDYMIDAKIPKSLRETVPLIANGQKIAWVVGYRMSEDVKVTAETKRVIEISVLNS